ncbi:hypothetical protein F4808DRAFT_418581 [Astrocystis sublimbata]|nr:hypothetical protein F4808DRAFT_418581 [Astrocystis sublimbata]
MASKAFFDPVALLRVAPVLTATMAMRYSHDQYFFLSTFLSPSVRAHTDTTRSIIPAYFRAFFLRGIWDIGALYTLTTATGLANLLGVNQRFGFGLNLSSVRDSVAWRWYAAGTALAVGHMAFVPFVMYKVQALFDDKPKGQADANLQKWLDVHVVRSWATDIPAWTCFVIGLLKSVEAF